MQKLEMKVIYAGFSKCGTKTMQRALQELGYTVYDFLENYEYLGNKWQKIFNEGGTKEDFYEMFKDVDAVTDMPAFYFWNQLLEAFPDAKIVFSQRATEEEWMKSMSNQIDQNENPFMSMIAVLLSPTHYRLRKWSIDMIRVIIGATPNGWFKSKKDKVNRMLFLHAYRSHNAYVLSCAPKEQLLVYSMGDGWGPLCEFLGREIPDKPFPHRNKKGSITMELINESALFKRIKTEMVISSSLLIAGSAYLIYRTYKNPIKFDFSAATELISGFNNFW